MCFISAVRWRKILGLVRNVGSRTEAKGETKVLRRETNKRRWAMMSYTGSLTSVEEKNYGQRTRLATQVDLSFDGTKT